MATENCTTPLPESLSPDFVSVPIPGSPIPDLETHRATVSYIGPQLPYLRLQGRWLERAGFAVGAPVRIQVVCRGVMILEVSEPEQPLRCAEPTCPHEAKARGKRRAGKVLADENDTTASLARRDPFAGFLD